MPQRMPSAPVSLSHLVLCNKAVGFVLYDKTVVQAPLCSDAAPT